MAVVAEALQSEAHAVFVSVEVAVAVVVPQQQPAEEAAEQPPPAQVAAEQEEQRQQQQEQQQQRNRASKHRNPGRLDSDRDLPRASEDEVRADRRQF